MITRRNIQILALSLLFCVTSRAQVTYSVIIPTTPPGGIGGSCNSTSIAYLMPTGSNNSQLVVCQSNVWAAVIASGTAFTAPSSGVFAGIPSCSTTRFTYYGTDSYYGTIYCDGSSTLHYFIDGKEVTLPGTASTWTLVTAGSAVKSDSAGSVLLSTASAATSLEALVQAVPSTPYTKTFVLSAYNSLIISGTPTANALATCGVFWTNGTSTSSAIQGIRYDTQYTASSPFQVITASWTNFAWAGGANVVQAYNAMVNPAKMYLQLGDTGSNKTLKISADGVNFTTIQTIAHGTPFVPTHMGFGCGEQNSGTGQPWSIALLGTY